MKKVTIHFRFCLFLIVAFAGNEKTALYGSPYEEIFLHIDRNKYIAGEYVWFSMYATGRETGRLSPESIIAYVELINPWNIPVIQNRFRLTGGKGEGAFLLPDSISSGTYLIRAYTNSMKSYLPDNCFMQDIDVYNPFRGNFFFRRTDPGEHSGDPFIIPGSVQGNKIEVSVDSVYGTRQNIIVGLKISNGESPREEIAEMSISVTLSDLVPADRQKSGLLSDGPVNHEQYKPEISGHFLSFLVKYRGDIKTDSSDFLFMSIQGKVADFNYASRDAGGRFTFILPVDNRPRTLVIQPEYATGNMILEMEPPFPRIFPEFECLKTEMNDFQLDLFSGLSFNYQASKIYGTDIKPATPADDLSLKKRRFYGIPEMEIFLDDYIRLPDMQEVFFELLPGIIIRERKAGYEMNITNPLTGSFYKEPPLVMIDGVIINDLAVLVDLDPVLVEKIEVVRTPYLFGDLILHGIVNVITREGNFSNITMPEYAVILPYRVVEKPPPFIAPEYSDEHKKLLRTPDLRNTLYWDPSVRTDKQGEASVTFWTSDLPGSYTINVQGITSAGEKISVQRSFNVR